MHHRTFVLFFCALSLMAAAHPRRRPSPSANGLSRAQRLTLLREHNRVRVKVGVRPLVWSAPLSAYAQAWANHLAATSCDLLQHRADLNRQDGRNYGENLAAQGAGGGDGRWNPVEGLQGWEAEKKDYHGGVIGDDVHVTGHYTQMIWQGSRRVGCGLAHCRKDGWRWHILACNYDPPGNIIGRKPF